MIQIEAATLCPPQTTKSQDTVSTTDKNNVILSTKSTATTLSPAQTTQTVSGWISLKINLFFCCIH